MPLSEKGLEASCQNSYKHDLLDIETELEKEKAEKDEFKRQKEEYLRQLEREEEERQAALEDNEDDEDRDTPVEEDGDQPIEEQEEDSDEYEIFYKSKDIKEALLKQKEDIFKELVQVQKKVAKDKHK